MWESELLLPGAVAAPQLSHSHLIISHLLNPQLQTHLQSSGSRFPRLFGFRLSEWWGPRPPLPGNVASLPCQTSQAYVSGSRSGTHPPLGFFLFLLSTLQIEFFSLCNECINLILKSDPRCPFPPKHTRTPSARCDVKQYHLKLTLNMSN